LGKAQVAVRATVIAATTTNYTRRAPLFAGGALIVMLALPLFADDYALVVAIDVAVFALFAASLHFIAGPAGMVSFGHAAYFGLGAYGAALAAVKLGFGLPAALAAGVTLAGLGAAAFGWFSVRLAGIYFAMLTLAFAQIAWSVAFQWDAVTGGSNGVIGVWPPPWLAQRPAFHLLALTLTAAGVAALWRAMDAPFGYALRAGRDSALRCDAIGIDLTRQQWLAFILVGALAGLAGGVYAFSKGSISPESLAIARSVDGLVMMLLGGIESRAGPLLGAAAFTWLQDEIARQTLYWRAALGAAILLIVLAFPHGVVGALRLWRAKANDGGGA
jgi:branched-chain amino acid transport system permease protein